MNSVSSIKIKIKCVRIIKKEYGRKTYFSKLIPVKVREYFATRVQMLPLDSNFCFGRTKAREEQKHIRQHCQLFKDI